MSTLDLVNIVSLESRKRLASHISGKTSNIERLKLVHTNIWGPALVKSLGSSHDYVTFIDDSTRKVWAYFLKKKSDMFFVFKKWKKKIEKIWCHSHVYGFVHDYWC